MEKYLEERVVLEMKYSELCKPLYNERWNVIAGSLDDEIKRIHNEGGGEKEEEGSKGDDYGRYDDTGEGHEKGGEHIPVGCLQRR